MCFTFYYNTLCKKAITDRGNEHGDDKASFSPLTQGCPAQMYYREGEKIIVVSSTAQTIACLFIVLL